ncbi:MAG: Fic family protein [Clostridia bacterium]|nr:Fic family protein [Clostridia bacterium]
MKFLSVVEIAKKWNISERSVRNYCALGKIEGAFLTGKTWNIPENAVKPDRINKKQSVPTTLLEILQAEKNSRISDGIYHKVQIELTYNSNHIEGSRLSHDQTRYIFETNMIGIGNVAINVDDIVETFNHFRCIDYVLETVNKPLSETLIKELHRILKMGTSDNRQSWFNVGEYKKFPNEVGGKKTVSPEKVSNEMKTLINGYNAKKTKTFDDILDFHYHFESIHPFQDGNGRIGRLILLKECLRNNIVPFIIDDELKLFYYRGLKEWENERGYLRDTCLTAQDKFKLWLDYFKIAY